MKKRIAVCLIIISVLTMVFGCGSDKPTYVKIVVLMPGTGEIMETTSIPLEVKYTGEIIIPEARLFSVVSEKIVGENETIDVDTYGKTPKEPGEYVIEYNFNQDLSNKKYSSAYNSIKLIILP